jgi:hypothetical protein
MRTACADDKYTSSSTGRTTFPRTVLPKQWLEAVGDECSRPASVSSEKKRVGQNASGFVSGPFGAAPPAANSHVFVGAPLGFMLDVAGEKHAAGAKVVMHDRTHAYAHTSINFLYTISTDVCDYRNGCNAHLKKLKQATLAPASLMPWKSCECVPSRR